MSPALELLLFVILVLAAVALVVMMRRGARAERRRREGLDRLTGRGAAGGEAAPNPLAGLESRLRAAGFRVEGTLYLLCVAAAAVLVGVLVLELFPGAWLAGLLAVLVVAYLGWVLVVEWARTRAQRFEERLADGVSFLVGALTVGENPLRAFSSAADACRGAVRAELEEVGRRLDAGMDIRRAVARMLERYDSPGTRLFCQTLIAKWNAGGDLVPVLQFVARTMRERLRLRLRVRRQLAGARLSAIFVALFPYIVVPVFYWRRPENLQRLVEHPMGPQLILAAVLLQIIGLLWIRRMYRIEM